MLGIAFKRGLRKRERTSSPRISDLAAIMSSTIGKLELDSVEEGREVKVVEGLIKKAVLEVFGRYFSPTEFDELIFKFDEGLEVETGSDIPSSAYRKKMPIMDNLAEVIRRVEPSDEPSSLASAIEFVLEGLHLNRKLNRERVAGKYIYRR